MFVNSVIHIGKESNNWEEAEIFGVGKKNYQIYLDGKIVEKKREEFNEFILNIKSEVVEEYGISPSALKKWKRKIKRNEMFRFTMKNSIKLIILNNRLV